MTAAAPFLAQAFALGARLCRDAIWDGPRCNWVGASSELCDGAWTVVQRSFGPDVYAGTAGVAWFLARLYRATGEELFLRTAEGAARQAVSRLDVVPGAQRFGLYTGLSGIAMALLDLGEAAGGDWREQGEALLDEVAGLDPEAAMLDVLAGVAGAIPALLGAPHPARRGDRLEAAVRLGDHLLAAGERRGAGMTWGRPALTGLSHGAAGVGWVLAELHAATGEERFRRGAEAAFDFEREHFSSAHGNWPDLRDRSQIPLAAAGGGAVYPLQWCHGAPGIALSRLRSWQLLGDPRLRDEAEVAVRTTRGGLDAAAPGTPPNFSLCHGIAGNADVLVYAAEVLGQPELLEVARRAGRHGIERHGHPAESWPSGVTDASTTPSLMLGLAGTGWFYLRLHDPRATPPAVLVLPEPTSPAG